MESECVLSSEINTDAQLVYEKTLIIYFGDTCKRSLNLWDTIQTVPLC